MKRVNKVIKRIFDFITSLLGIIVLSPILILISLLIIINDKGPILFKQKRVGKDEEVFEIYKFRTMVVDAEKKGKQITVDGDSRITSVGNILRKYKLDELPQLFNVLKGDMSLVGPRPEVPYYVGFYSEEQKKVFSFKPGITDLASIRYRNENEILKTVKNAEEYYIDTIMPEKLKLNMEYIEKSNLFFDIYIILKTIKKCIK